MIEDTATPSLGRVAGIALFGSPDMSARFAGGLGAVVATCTGSGVKLGVIELGDRPPTGGVAGVALCSGLRVVATLAQRPTAVMAAGTGTENRHMVDPTHLAPTERRVTELTIVGSAYVSNCLALSLVPIMATFARVCNAAVIKTGYPPG